MGFIDEDKVWHKDISGARLWVTDDGEVWVGLLDDYGNGTHVVRDSSLCVATNFTELDEVVAGLREARTKLGPTHYPPGMGEESRRLHREYNALVAAQQNGAMNGAAVVKLTDEAASKGIVLVPGGESL
jgi:hypothetical protein